MKEKLKL